MELPNGFAERLSAISESTPRNAIENLLLGLMPRQAVSTRPVSVDSGGRPIQPQTAQQKEWTSRFDRTRAPRSRKPKGGEYEVLQPMAFINHRPGTWRRAMVEAATNYVATDDDGKWSSQSKALEYLKEHYPQHYSKGVDFSWCANVGYIKL